MIDKRWKNFFLGIIIILAIFIIGYVITGPFSAKFFFKQGFQHILSGYDHILFILAIHLIVRKPLHILEIVTAFTIAHSITLVFSALGWITLPSNLVEATIAATILIMALENLNAIKRGPKFKNEIKWRWGLTSVFGLIHGLGFAGYLTQLIAAEKSLLPSIIGFNLGVEAGQLTIVAIILPFLWLLSKKPKLDKAITTLISIIIGLIAIYWMIIRIF